MSTEQYVAQEDDTIGGWCVTKGPTRPGDGNRTVASFTTEEMAREVADALNARQDPFHGPEWEQFVGHVKDKLLPMLDESAITVSLCPPEGHVDVKFAVELGFMIMLNKPILAVVPPGTPVPPKLALVADHIVEVDLTQPDGPAKFIEALAVMDERLENPLRVVPDDLDS